MIGLYTGARVNEVCQLKLNDIVEERGVWCIAFQKTVDKDLAADPKKKRRCRQSMKGAGCMRIVPIAKPLLDAGFLEFVEDMKDTGHSRLFPLLSAGISRSTGETNARYSQQFVVDFGRYLKGLGFEKGIGFHAFRHTLATELDANDVPEKEIALVTGHSTDPRDRVQVLRKHYLHKRPQVTRSKQIKALDLYQPAVELPRYQPGQFAKWLSDSSKFYPKATACTYGATRASIFSYQRLGVAPVNRLVPRAFHQFTHARSKAHARPGISYVQPERNRLRFPSSNEAIGLDP